MSRPRSEWTPGAAYHLGMIVACVIAVLVAVSLSYLGLTAARAFMVIVAVLLTAFCIWMLVHSWRELRKLLGEKRAPQKGREG